MSKIRGITVILFDTAQTELDPFGDPVYTESEIEVNNVIVAPASSEEIQDSHNLYGRKAVYTLAIPKDDTHDWENKRVDFFGESWRTFGIPLEGIEAMIPLEWNKKVMVERYE